MCYYSLFDNCKHIVIIFGHILAIFQFQCQNVYSNIYYLLVNTFYELQFYSRHCGALSVV